MSNRLTMKDLLSDHPETFIIASVAFRDGISNKAVAFTVLQTADTVEEILDLLYEFRSQGHSKAFALANFVDMEIESHQLPPSELAFFMREYYGNSALQVSSESYRYIIKL